MKVSGPAVFIVGTVAGSVLLAAFYWILTIATSEYEGMPGVAQAARGLSLSFLFIAGLGLAVVSVMKRRRGTRAAVGAGVGILLAMLQSQFGGMPAFLFGSQYQVGTETGWMALRGVFYASLFAYLFARFKPTGTRSST